MIVIHRYSLLINHKKSSTKMMTSLETEGPSPYLVGWWLWSPPHPLVSWFYIYIECSFPMFRCKILITGRARSQKRSTILFKKSRPSLTSVLWSWGFIAQGNNFCLNSIVQKCQRSTHWEYKHFLITTCQ